MPGYKIHIHDNQDEVRDGLKCTYCRLILKDPVQTNKSGLRYCKECFKEAARNSAVDPSDTTWPDSAVKKEIEKLRVICEHSKAGCEWQGLFKDFLEHIQSCQYVTVECRNSGCGERVLLTKIEEHLKSECHCRVVKCKDCEKEMLAKELEAHQIHCPNILKRCQHCQQEMPAYKLSEHAVKECTWIKCPCSSSEGKDVQFEETSTEYHEHLKDITKLAHHLQPLLSQFSRISNAYQLVVNRIDVLEAKSDMLEERNNNLLQENVELQKAIKSLTARIEVKEKELNVSQVGSIVHADSDRICNLELNSSRLNAELLTIKSSVSKNFEAISGDIERIKRDSTQKVSNGNEVVPYKNTSVEYVRQVEEKMLEVERTLNVLSVHHSELELQLQASLASTHNGAFLWRVPEVRRRIRDAKMGRITSIYSPPFYTGRNGYKMCIRAYLNGDGSGEGTHLSIFFVLMKGEYDPLLQWPFEHKVSLVLVDQDQKKHLVQTFKPNLNSNSFQRPKSDMNVASGCPEFAKLSILDDPSYVKDDVMYIKAIVDTSKILHP